MELQVTSKNILIAIIEYIAIKFYTDKKEQYGKTN